jgi:sialate O-acetylesterase
VGGIATSRAERKQVLSATAAFVVIATVLMVIVAASPGLLDPYPKTLVACVGDSITEGSLYPAYLQELLGSGYNVENFGSGGSTVLLSSDKPYMNQPVFAHAAELRPDIVVIILGTNDANPRFFGDIESFVADYTQLIRAFHSAQKIWIVIPPPILDDGLGPKEANLVEGVIPRIHQVATELNYPTIDVYSLLQGKSDFFSRDGVHPNAKGSQAIADAVYLAITSQQ